MNTERRTPSGLITLSSKADEGVKELADAFKLMLDVIDQGLALKWPEASEEDRASATGAVLGGSLGTQLLIEVLSRKLV